MLQIAIAAILLISLIYILGGLHHDPFFGYLYPVSWLIIFPKGYAIASFINSFAVNDWWMLVEIGLTFFIWLVIFFLIRGVYYYMTSVGDMSTWKVFVICIGIGIIFFVLLLIPVYRQIDVWWEAWPEIREPKVAGGE